MLEKIKEVFKQKGYVFLTGNHNINLIGIRNSDNITNEFDDILIVVIEVNGGTRIKNFDNFTTDPGNFYVKEKLLNPNGCAIVKPGQYQGLFSIGKHKNDYPALVQVGEIIVFRDANKDELISKGLEDKGNFGINLHHAFDSVNVDKYSAGCQVLKSKEDLDYILSLCKLSAKTYGNKFTYTLLERKDFEEESEIEIKRQNEIKAEEKRKLEEKKKAEAEEKKKAAEEKKKIESDAKKKAAEEKKKAAEATK